MSQDLNLKRWRLILGQQADPQHIAELNSTETGMDRVLEALYDSERTGGLCDSYPVVNRWLGDIRRYFSTPLVQIMQKDAIERLNLQRLLFEPELLQSLEPDVHLVATLLSLNKVMPAKTKETARIVVRKVVEELEKKLRFPLEQAVKGALSRSVRSRRPRLIEIDWHASIRRNLKNYQHQLRTIIPERFIGYGRKNHTLKQVILLVDQSGSMASSVVYAGIFGAVLASIRALRTNFVLFDTAVADLTAELNDPVELLFCTQLGGGTNIGKALAYAQQLIQSPADTVLFLITDLFEGADEESLLKSITTMATSGVRIVILLALDDQGAPAWNKPLSARLAALNIPAFACTPDQFPSVMETYLRP